MIQDQVGRLAAIGAAFAVCLRQGCVPDFMLLLELSPFGLFDLGRNAAFVRRYAGRRGMDPTAAFHKAQELTAGFVAVAAAAQPPTVGAVLVLAQQPYPSVVQMVVQRIYCKLYKSCEGLVRYCGEVTIFCPNPSDPCHIKMDAKRWMQIKTYENRSDFNPMSRL